MLKPNGNFYQGRKSMKKIFFILFFIALFSFFRPALVGEAFADSAPGKFLFDPSTLILIGVLLLCISTLGREKSRK